VSSVASELRRVCLLLTASLAVSGCAIITGRPDYWAAMNRSTLEDLAYVQGCPAVGMPLDRLRKSTGVRRDDSLSSQQPAAELWSKRYKGGATVLVEITEGRVNAWDVSGPVTPELAEPSPYWSINHSEAFRQAVTEFIEGAHPSAKTAFAMYRACPYAGMTVAEVEASWGNLQEVPRAEGSRVRAKRFPLHYWYLEFVFSDDSLAYSHTGMRGND
jgi:hypothetical protein